MWNFSSFPVRLATALDNDGCRSPFAVSAPAELADEIAFLTSPQASYVNGQILGIDGGMTIW